MDSDIKSGFRDIKMQNEKREIASEEISSPSRFTVFWFQMQMKICIQEISLLSPFYISWLQDLEII